MAHAKSEHDGKRFQCQICDCLFKKDFQLRYHIDGVHENKWRAKCEICNQTFQDKRNLNRHYLHVHEGVKLHKCEI